MSGSRCWGALVARGSCGLFERVLSESNRAHRWVITQRQPCRQYPIGGTNIMRINRVSFGRLAMATATGGFMMGIALLNTGTAHAIGGLCNGRPASHTWLDASGQYGPAVIDGTKGDDTIVGSDGDDTIDGRGGNDFVCGGPGNDSISVGPGGNVVRGDTGDDSITASNVHSATLVGDGGN